MSDLLLFELGFIIGLLIILLTVGLCKDKKEYKQLSMSYKDQMEITKAGSDE